MNICVSGSISIDGGITFSHDQLTLTCISTGGPATTATWTRDSTTTVTEGTETVLDDPVTAQYTHTLNVTTAGEYTIKVSNNKPSFNSASIRIGMCTGSCIVVALWLFITLGTTPPSNVTAVQDGPTSIQVSWTPSGDATGYIIIYDNSEGDSGYQSVSGGSTDQYILTDLQAGGNYIISLLATSQDLPSKPVRLEARLSECFGMHTHVKIILSHQL